MVKTVWKHNAVRGTGNVIMLKIKQRFSIWFSLQGWVNSNISVLIKYFMGRPTQTQKQ